MDGIVQLEPLRIRHADAIQRLLADPTVRETTRLPEPYPADGALRWIESLQVRSRQGDEIGYVINHHRYGVVGACGAVYQWPMKSALIGYWIGRPYWGQGIATAATARLLYYLIVHAQLTEVAAETLKRNVASRRVLEKLGFAMVHEVINTEPRWRCDDWIVRYELAQRAWRISNAIKAADKMAD